MTPSERDSYLDAIDNTNSADGTTVDMAHLVNLVRRCERAEAALDRVRALCADEWGRLDDTVERCAVCRRKWSKHTDWDEHHYGLSDHVAAFVTQVLAAIDGATP